MRFLSFSLLASLVAGTAACSASTTDSESTAADVTDAAPVALRYATSYTSGGTAKWRAVVETKGRYFREEVSIHYLGQDGSWRDQPGRFLRESGGDKALWVVDDLPALEPFVFSVHYLTIYSYGSGNSYWDSNGGRNYTVRRTEPALGPGVDVAVTDLDVNASTLSASILVRNVAPEKSVKAIYTTDDWQTTKTAAARYDHGGGEGSDVWLLRVPVDSATDVKLAVLAEQQGAQAWDNNFGSNFECRLDAGRSWQCTGVGAEGGVRP